MLVVVEKASPPSENSDATTAVVVAEPVGIVGNLEELSTSPQAG